MNCVFNNDYVCVTCGKVAPGGAQDYIDAHYEPNQIHVMCRGFVTPEVRAKIEAVHEAQYEKVKLMKRALNFTVAAIKHVYKLCPTCTQEQIDARVEICKACNYFKPDNVNPNIGTCSHPACGCCVNAETWLISKLAWADQSCPIKKWLAIDTNARPMGK